MSADYRCDWELSIWNGDVDAGADPDIIDVVVALQRWGVLPIAGVAHLPAIPAFDESVDPRGDEVAGTQPRPIEIAITGVFERVGIVLIVVAPIDREPEVGLEPTAASLQVRCSTS